MATKRPTVAVIGAGPAGLVALKNLVEEGFNATGFDKNSSVGGLWQYTEEDRTSVLRTTVVNNSKQRGCFTDYPYPEDISSYPTAAEVQQYLVSYAEHFKLGPHLRLNATVNQITFIDDRHQWAVHIEGEDVQHFDKVVIAIGGLTSLPHVPEIGGLDKFMGTALHSRAFKKPESFIGKQVMVVGFGNTAADTATALAGLTEKVYIAHRNGARIIPRRINGIPIDHAISWRLLGIQRWIMTNFPVYGSKIFGDSIKSLQDKSFKLRPEWGFEPAQVDAIVSDNLVDYLENGLIESTKGIKRVVSDKRVELDDDRVVDIDALIFCTGYKADFSMLEPRFDPTSRTEAAWTNANGSNSKPLIRLYHNVFSLEKPDSLAFLGYVHITLVGFFQRSDMASMAITQVWKGASSLPTRAEMTKAVDEHHAWLAQQANSRSNVSPGMVDGQTWLCALDDLAGTGVNEYLGWGWRGWWFWVTNMRLCNILRGGIWSPHIHRFFDGKRKKWEGARQAIEKVNRAGETAGKSKTV